MRSICIAIALLCVVSAGLAQTPATALLGKADSLFSSRAWGDAKKAYESYLTDTSHNALAWNRLGFSNYNLKLYSDASRCYEKSLSFNPAGGLKAVVYSRLAKVHALQNNKMKAIAELDSAASAGYVNINELDTLADFNSLRNVADFKAVRQKVYAAAYPCMADPHAREFDFWIGEWDVYQSGTKNLAGHGLVQMISGGCALLENWDSPNSTGKSINFIDPVTNKWKQSWAGSYAAGIQEFVNGEYKDGAMRFTFEFTGAKGVKNIGRFMFFNEGPNQVRQFNETSVDGGKTWITSYDFTYIRKK